MTLVHAVAAAVSIPVIAAGGIADGEGVAAGFMLGAEAVQVGTRFVATESNAHPKYKEKNLKKARDIDTTISAQHFGHAVRAIKNQLTRMTLSRLKKDAFKQENPDLEIFEQMGAGALAKAVVHGDEGGSVMTGQIRLVWFQRGNCRRNLKDLYYGAAKKIQEEASRWAGVVRND